MHYIDHGGQVVRFTGWANTQDKPLPRLEAPGYEKVTLTNVLLATARHIWRVDMVKPLVLRREQKD